MSRPVATNVTPPVSAQLGDVDEAERERTMRLYVEQRRAFQAHAGVFAAGMVVIIVVNLMTNVAAGIAGDWSAWWSAWAFIGWSLGIGVHGFVLLLNRPTHFAPRRQRNTTERTRQPMESRRAAHASQLDRASTELGRASTWRPGPRSRIAPSPAPGPERIWLSGSGVGERVPEPSIERGRARPNTRHDTVRSIPWSATIAGPRYR